MKRPKRFRGLCGEDFVQDEYMMKGQIHIECQKAWIRADYDVGTINDAVKKCCTECLRENE